MGFLVPLVFLFFISKVGAQSILLTDQDKVSEEVYVESPVDSDNDGKLDLIYVSIDRPSFSKRLSTIYMISPYALGGNEDAANHGVDSELLPQDERNSRLYPIFYKSLYLKNYKTLHNSQFQFNSDASRYAQLRAHSLGTGKSTGCPTVGDISETLAAKSVIDWLNGRARAFNEFGEKVDADWANGKVGMIGTSYDGTLPIMIATTGVKELKAIVPIAAISNWYDYYRANGLVVGPGGYIGEDADVLGYYIVRRGRCLPQLEKITQNMGREHGDYSKFWKERNHLNDVAKIKAATFIIHGQADWNVKQKHPIQLWEALEGVAPRRMFLHRGGHGSTSKFDVPRKIQEWFDHFLQDEENGVTSGPMIEVELPDGSLVAQEEWPHEDSKTQRFYFSENSSLTSVFKDEFQLRITDQGQSKKMEALIEGPQDKKEERIVFLTSTLSKSSLISGTPLVSLNLSVLNRKAANIAVALVEYDKNGRAQIITRGWADPQNYQDQSKGELLIPGENYQLTFSLEPKQYRLSPGSKLGVVLTSTDYDFTLRPKAGTQIQFNLGKNSFIDLELTP